MLRAAARWLDKASVKGTKEPVGVYMVISEEENMTVIRSPLVAAEIDGLRLNLRYRDKSVTLEEPMPEFVPGRQVTRDRVADSDSASRRPAPHQALHEIGRASFRGNRGK